MADVRLDALHILLQAESGPRFAQDLIASSIEKNRPSQRDAALLAEIVYGVIRHRLTLDSIISTFSKSPLRKIDPKCLSILRMGVYQVLFLDRVPAPAAVNESVKLAPKAHISSASGFVNAVLRAVVRHLERGRREKPDDPTRTVCIRREDVWAVFTRPVLPDPAKDEAAHLAAAYSHPRWLVERWIRRWGTEKATSILRANNHIPPLSVRVNRLKTDRDALLQRLRNEGVEAQEGEMPLSVRLGPGTRIADLTAFREGLFQVQDETSMRVVELLDPKPGETVLDLCAAPGGKTTHIAERMNNLGTVIALDRSADRLGKVKENLDRLGIRCVHCVTADGARQWLKAGAAFDRVLVDVPCSNTGVLARRVEARWRLSADDILELSQNQKTLLASAVHAVRPGGVLAYSTCSIEEEENEAVIASALECGLLTKQSEHLFLPRPKAGGGYVAILVRSR